MAINSFILLIINSPYEKLQIHCRYYLETRNLGLVKGYRTTGYAVATLDSKAFNALSLFLKILLVNQSCTFAALRAGLLLKLISDEAWVRNAEKIFYRG
jgi:hypothetical protein